MSDSEIVSLSEREIEILKLVATGVSNKEIASSLNISPNTVKVHLRNIFTKANLNSRTEATLYAIRLGLVDAPMQPGARTSDEVNGEGTPAVKPMPWPWLIIGLAVVIVGAVLGWRAASSRNLATAPSVERWSESVEMPIPLTDFSAMAMNGKVFIIGGLSLDGMNDQTLILDQASKKWTNGAELPLSVSNSATAGIGEEIVLIGGTSEDGAASNTVQLYDPLTNIWSAGSSLPVSLTEACAVAYEGSIWLFGGRHDAEISNSIYRSADLAQSWQLVGSLPTKLAGSGCAVSENRILIFGGETETGMTNQVWSVAPARITDTTIDWTRLSNMPFAAKGFPFTGLASGVYVFDVSGTSAGYRYDSDANTWETVQPSPAPSGAGTRAVADGAVIHLLGGTRQGDLSSQHYLYQAFYIVNVPAVIR